MYGKGFDEPMPLIVLAFSTIFTSISTVLGISISSLAKMWVWFGVSVIWSATTIVMSYIFVTNGYQATGVAIAVLIGYVVHSLIQYIYLRKKFK